MRREIVTVTFVLIFVLLSLSLHETLETKAVYAFSSEGLMIDIYTQKEPYSGKGPNQPSDAFAPEEIVMLYAYVSYNLAPVEGKIVTFKINGPPNLLNNITFSQTAETNASGLARVVFRIPWPENPETITFGEWRANATVEIAEKIGEDTLTFKVGWIIDILSLITVNKDQQSQTKFAKGMYVGVEITLRNVALIPKNVTIVIGTCDLLDHMFDLVILSDFEIEPGETHAYCLLQIPEWVALGDATAYANAYTASGVVYCPQASTTFVITPLGDLNDDGIVDMKDLYIVIKAFGSYPSHPKWNPIADIDEDDKVDMKDIYLVITNFGKEDC